jgi:hypothetical protein
MDKKNVQKLDGEKVLTENFFCLDTEKLSSQIKPINLILL